MKFLNFKWAGGRQPQFNDASKWHTSDNGKTYKLLKPDLKTDKQFATAHIKIVKQLEENQRLTIGGIANANIVDRMQERLDPTGIDLEDYLKNAQLLAHHSYYHPIGQVESLQIQDDGIHFSAWIGDPQKAPLTEMQKEIRSLVAQGILKTVSVGFIPKRIRSPQYDDQGNMTEPCVIEKWELLELSVVAVPANQDSVFEMRNLENSDTIESEPKKSQSLNDLKSKLAENAVVQSLIFDQAKFTEIDAKNWAASFAKERGQKESLVLEFFNSTTHECDDLELTEGVFAVTIKSKKDAKKEETAATGEKAGESSDTDQENVQQQMLSLMQQLSEGQKRVTEICELMLKKMEEKPADDSSAEAESEGEGKTVEQEVSAEPTAEEKAIDERFAKIEGVMEKLAKGLDLLCAKVIK